MGSSCSSLLKRRSGDSEPDASEYRYGLPIQRVSKPYLSSEYSKVTFPASIRALGRAPPPCADQELLSARRTCRNAQTFSKVRVLVYLLHKVTIWKALENLCDVLICCAPQTWRERGPRARAANHHQSN